MYYLCMAPPKIPLELRYERHIRRGPELDDCWLWAGNANQAGYGQFRVGRRGNPVISVHRWAYSYFVGPIPDGAWVLHRCDNPRCSNPKHLYAGTPMNNAADCVDRERRAKKHKFGARQMKLTDAHVRAIRKDTRPAMCVARRYGISEPHVSAIRSRKRKGHVPD